MPINNVYDFSVRVPDVVLTAVEHIQAACPSDVYYNSNGDAIVLDSLNHEWVARVYHDTVEAHIEEAYLSTEPIENYVDTVEDTYVHENLPELKGFTTGFTC